MKATIEEGAINIIPETEEEIILLNKNRKNAIHNTSDGNPDCNFLDSEGCYVSPREMKEEVRGLLILFPCKDW